MGKPGWYSIGFINLDDKPSDMNPFKVISAVVQTIKEFSKSNPVQGLFFMASDQSKARLYLRMIKNFLPNASMNLIKTDCILP
jgi:hypothetical protein